MSLQMTLVRRTDPDPLTSIASLRPPGPRAVGNCSLRCSAPLALLTNVAENFGQSCRRTMYRPTPVVVTAEGEPNVTESGTHLLVLVPGGVLGVAASVA